MKHMNKGLLLAGAALLLSSAVAGCSDDDNTVVIPDTGGTDTGSDTVDPNPSGCAVATDPNANIIDVPFEIVTDTTWTCDNIYRLTQLTYVDDDAVLTIEPGTLIVGTDGAALVVTADGRIEASGTRTQPIVFTGEAVLDGEEPESGDWGGVVMLGRARLNVPGGTDQIEGIDPTEDRAEYGGDDDTHNCGTIRYVQINYAGDQFGQDNELNSLTLGGCGNQTTLEYIQVHRGLDDGIEFFGGNVDLRYALITEPDDDGLDLDQGYRGRIQFVVVHMTNPTSNDPRAFEWDGLSGNENNEPFTTPNLYNATILQSTSNAGVLGAKIRRGCAGFVRNLLVFGFSGAYYDIDGVNTLARIDDGDAGHDGIAFIGNRASLADYFPNRAGELNHVEYFEDMGTFLQTANRGDWLVGSGVIPAVGSDLDGAGITPPNDGWFVQTDYIGAFEPSGEDWTTGWTIAWPPSL